MIVLPSVKVALVNVVLSARPNNGNSKAQRVTSLKIHPLPLSRNIGHHELALSHLGNDSITDLVIEFLQIYTNHLVTSGYSSGFYGVSKHMIHRVIKPHRNKTLYRC